MKISGRGIQEFLTKPPAAVTAVLFYGHDRGLVKEYAQSFAKKAVPDLDDPFSVTRLDADAVVSTPALLIDSAAMMPPMGGRRLVLVNDAGAGINDACKNLLANPPAESLSIITANESVNTRTPLVKTFEQSEQAAAVGCYHDTNQSLTAMAREIFNAASIRIDRDALDWVVNHLGADRMASRQEIEKLTLLAGENGQLNLEAVQKALGDGAIIAVSDIVHAAASGKTNMLGEALDRAAAIEGERIIREAILYFGRLFRIAAAIEEGMSRDQAIKSIQPRIHFTEEKFITSHLRFWSAKRCQTAIMQLEQAEMESRRGIDAHITSAQTLLSLARAVR